VNCCWVSFGVKCVKYYVSFRVCTYKDLHFRDANLWQNLVIRHSLSLASLSFHCISHSAARAAALLTLLVPPTWCALRAKTVRPIHNTSKFNSISRSLTLSARAKPLAYALPFSHFLACKCMQRSLRAHGAAADEIKVRAEWCFWCMIVPQNAALIRPHA
jgi:hypothetical protein